MPFAFKLLYANNVTATSSTPYKVGVTKDPNASSAIVSNVRIYNKGGSSMTVTIFVKASDAAQSVTVAKAVSVASSASYIYNKELALQNGASVGISTSASPNFDCVLCGVERV